MIESTYQETRHIRVGFQNELDFVLLHVNARCAISEMFRFELTLFHGDTSQPVEPADVIDLGVNVTVDMPGESFR